MRGRAERLFSRTILLVWGNAGGWVLLLKSAKMKIHFIMTKIKDIPKVVLINLKKLMVLGRKIIFLVLRTKG